MKVNYHDFKELLSMSKNTFSFQESLDPCEINKVYFNGIEYYCLKEQNYVHFFKRWDDLLDFLRFYDFGSYEKGSEFYE